MQGFRWITGPAITLSALSPCHAATYLTIDQAQAALFPGETLVLQQRILTPEQIKAVEASAKSPVRSSELRVWKSFTGGYFFVDQVIGKHDLITFALAVDGDGAVKGIEILEYREAYGYEVRNAKWRAQFIGKTHAAPLTVDSDIKSISGATLSTRHVTEAVRRLLAVYAIALQP